MADGFCRQYVDTIFSKYDGDNSNVLDRREIKAWMRSAINNNPLHKRLTKKEFNRFLADADTNGDGKLDRWEIYNYCVKNYVE